MFDIQFSEAYYPELEAVAPEKLAAARAFVVSRLRPTFGDVDLSPGTVTGDLVVSPLAAFVAASDEAHGRLMSDLDLENVAAGVIYSCDFVRAYLGNFGVYDVENLRSSGLARLTFSANGTYTLNRSTRYLFGTSEFSIRFDDDSTDTFTILPSDTAPSGRANSGILAQTSATTFSVDVPVEGVMTELVIRGTAGRSNAVASQLIGISAATTFSFGLAPSSLPDLARLARRLSVTATASTRSGTSAMIFRNWPESQMVSPIITGDVDFQRSAPGSALVFQAPAMDVYYQSTRAQQEEVQIVRIPLGNGPLFRGPVTFLHRPSKLLSVKWAGRTEGVIGYKLYSKSSRIDIAGSLYCGSSFEQFWIEIQSAVDGTSTPVITRGATDNSANFEIRYIADPVLRSVSGVLQSADNRTPGVDVIVKAGPLIDISKLEITYRKSLGVKVLTSAARTKIAAYINAAAWPDPFDVAEIYAIMRYAGAAAVVDINVVAELSVTPAHRRILPASVPTPVSSRDWTANTFSITSPKLPITTIAGLKPDVIHSSFTGLVGEAYAATERTVRYLIAEDTITFKEA